MKATQSFPLHEWCTLGGVRYQLPDLGDDAIMFKARIMDFSSQRSGDTLLAVVGEVDDGYLSVWWSFGGAYALPKADLGYPKGTVGLVARTPKTQPEYDRLLAQRVPRQYWAIVKKYREKQSWKCALLPRTLQETELGVFEEIRDYYGERGTELLSLQDFLDVLDIDVIEMLQGHLHLEWDSWYLFIGLKGEPDLYSEFDELREVLEFYDQYASPSDLAVMGRANAESADYESRRRVDMLRKEVWRFYENDSLFDPSDISTYPDRD